MALTEAAETYGEGFGSSCVHIFCLAREHSDGGSQQASDRANTELSPFTAMDEGISLDIIFILALCCCRTLPFHQMILWHAAGRYLPFRYR